VNLVFTKKKKKTKERKAGSNRDIISVGFKSVLKDIGVRGGAVG
jgi:hypothetical protein